jgi:hypothetical protein
MKFPLLYYTRTKAGNIKVRTGFRDDCEETSMADGVLIERKTSLNIVVVLE